jgi:hypothetical protein
MREGLAEFIQMYGIETRQVDGCGCLVMYKAVRMDFGSWYNRRYPQKDAGAYRLGTAVATGLFYNFGPTMVRSC